MSQSDLITVGLSETADDRLTELAEMGIFGEKIDAYRFAIALAISHGVIPLEIEKRRTLYNVGSLDPDQTLRRAVEAIMPDQLKTVSVYRLIERLAEWGVNELYAEAKSGGIDFERLLAGVEAKVD